MLIFILKKTIKLYTLPISRKRKIFLLYVISSFYTYPRGIQEIWIPTQHRFVLDHLINDRVVQLGEFTGENHRTTCNKI